ncbi:Mobile element protein [Levilactobacillus brevis]|nr:Mobile element protein [Levilactobacillus brevis]
MIKESSRKWKSDDRKVMNWDYYEADDYYVDSKGVRFNFKAYRKRTDKYGFIRDFKEYVAEKLDENQNVISEALTPKGNLRRIQVDNAWEYFKAKQRDLLSTSQTAAIYAQRKIDVEPIFGKMKASLRFHRFSVRGLDRVRKEAGIVIMALNIRKLVTMVTTSPTLKLCMESILSEIFSAFKDFRIWSKDCINYQFLCIINFSILLKGYADVSWTSITFFCID